MSSTSSAPFRASRRHLFGGTSVALATGASFGVSGSLGKALMRTGWSPATVITLRVTIGAAFLAVPALLAMRGRWTVLRGSARLVGVYGAMAVSGAQLGFYQAVERLSVGVALLLQYLGLVLVVGWMWAVHGQRPRRLTALGALVAIGGLTGVLDVFSGFRLDAVGVLWALFAAFGLATFYVVSSRTHHDALPPVALAGFGLATGAATLWVALAAGVLRWRVGSMHGLLRGVEVPWWVMLGTLGVLSCAVAYVLGIAAARLLGATLATFLGLSEVLFAVAFAWLLLGESPRPAQAIGGVAVIAGIVLVQLGEWRRR